jgi:hypothetical protein
MLVLASVVDGSRFELVLTNDLAGSSRKTLEVRWGAMFYDAERLKVVEKFLRRYF